MQERRKITAIEYLPEDKAKLAELQKQIDKQAEWIDGYGQEIAYAEDYQHKQDYMYPRMERGRKELENLKEQYAAAQAEAEHNSIKQ